MTVWRERGHYGLLNPYNVDVDQDFLRQYLAITRINKWHRDQRRQVLNYAKGRRLAIQKITTPPKGSFPSINIRVVSVTLLACRYIASGGYASSVPLYTILLCALFYSFWVRRSPFRRTTLGTLVGQRCRENPALRADRETEPPGFWTAGA